MNSAAVIAALKRNQLALALIIMLELTGYQYPPPAVLKPNDAFDYIIIGGGTAGSVVATRLAQQKYNVLLIEAGEDAPFESVYPSLVTFLKNTQADWNYTSENDKYSYQCQARKKVELSQGRMLGGTGALNYMAYSRGNPENFEEWFRITKDPNWKWVNVLPYFIKAEAIYDNAINDSFKYLYGNKGYIRVTRENSTYTSQFLKGFEQIGKHIIDDIDGNKIGYSRALITVYDGMRQDSGSQYLSRVTYNRYLAVAKGTLATKIIFDNNRNAVGVEVITDEGKTIVVNARQEIILSAGAIKSPQLLMLSGLGPKKDLQKLNISCICDIPVGKNLQDHIAVVIPHKTNRTMVREKVDPGKYPVGLIIGYASLNESIKKDHLKFPDYLAMGFVANNLKFMLQFCALTLNLPNRTCNKLLEESDGNQLLITTLSNLYSHSRGQVLLRSTDPRDSPKVFTDSFSNDRDLDDIVKYIRHYLKVEESEAFKSLRATRVDLTAPRCDAFKRGSREYWRCYTLCMMVSLTHYSGTCAMGSVVDSRLRVRSVNRLRVADASIMPTHVTGNIFQSVVMIGEKAADIIIEDAGAYNDVEHEQIRLDQIKNLP